jgi:hypothetical protein
VAGARGIQLPTRAKACQFATGVDIADGAPTTFERLGSDASRAMLLTSADFEEPRIKRRRLLCQ